MDFNQISSQIIKAAINVHKDLGPGLLESVYQAAMVLELRHKGIFISHRARRETQRVRNYFSICLHRRFQSQRWNWTWVWDETKRWVNSFFLINRYPLSTLWDSECSNERSEWARGFFKRISMAQEAYGNDSEKPVSLALQVLREDRAIDDRDASPTRDGELKYALYERIFRGRLPWI